MFFLYRTVCLVTSHFYVGVHSASELEDGYLGSGIRIKRSIRKYGRENHSREIVEFFESESLMYAREAEVVNKELLKNPHCLNLAVGGEGGFISISSAAAGGKSTTWSNTIKSRKEKKEKIAHYSQDKKCEFCQKSFSVNWKRRNTRFCSHKCRSENLKKGR